MTHTLEVAQISRSIAQALALNADLTEAIALGHDLGHTPYGHIGEAALSDCLRELASDPAYQGPEDFSHHEQSLRVVDIIENEGVGLNLTDQVRDGIVHHTGVHLAKSREGQVVAIADRIAYVNHDTDDALRAGILKSSELPATVCQLLGETHSARITTLVEDLVEYSEKSGVIAMSPEIWDAMMELRSFLFDHVYRASDAKVEEPKAYQLVQMLFAHYLGAIDEVPDDYRRTAAGDEVQAVLDYVSGMTDRFATARFVEIFVPSNWRNIATFVSHSSE
jgi:dGTPase